MSASLRIVAPAGSAGFDPVATAVRLAPTLVERAARHDRAGTFAHENLAALREAGLAALSVPRELGGEGIGLATASAVVGALATGDPATSLVLAMQILHRAAIARSSSWPKGLTARVQRAAVEDGAVLNALRVEPELGSPARGSLPATTARRTPEGWRLSGRKIYSTGAPALAWALVWARTDEPEPRVGLVLVQMDAPGIRVEETWDGLGLRASGSHDVVLDDVAVPTDHAVDLRPPAAWAPDAETLSWNTVLVASLYDGVARAAQSWLVGFLRERAPANLGAPLSSLPRFQEAVGENERLLATNRLLLAGAAAATDGGRPPSCVESGLLKLTVTENAIAAVQHAVELTGNPGLSRANPLERHLRDVLCARIHTPQGDGVRLAAGRSALGI